MAPAAVPIAAAEEGRVIESAAPSHEPADAPKAVAPDLDVLARQVYAVLKRRLEAEMRREQMF